MLYSAKYEQKPVSSSHLYRAVIQANGSLGLIRYIKDKKIKSPLINARALVHFVKELVLVYIVQIYFFYGDFYAYCNC